MPLNDLPSGVMDPASLRARYQEERAKRLRADGKAQYRPVFSERPELLADPFTPSITPRESIIADVDALVVGAGMSGIMTAAALRRAGVDSLVVLDGAADFGGTWYWNRYPGAQCDTEAYIYMPWLEDTGYMPTAKYAAGPSCSTISRASRTSTIYERTRCSRPAQHGWNGKPTRNAGS